MSEGPSQFYVPVKKRKDRTTRGTGAKYRKKSGVFATPAGFYPSGSGTGTRASVMRAAEVFAEQARRNAAKFSRRIPIATHVEAYAEQQAQIVTDGDRAPNAAPFEFGERHPLNYPNQVASVNKYGRPRHWKKQPMRSYMSRAANNKTAIAKASEIYGEAEKQLLAEEHGYTE